MTLGNKCAGGNRAVIDSRDALETKAKVLVAITEPIQQIFELQTASYIRYWTRHYYLLSLVTVNNFFNRLVNCIKYNQ